MFCENGRPFMSFYVTVSLGHPPTPHTPARRLLTRSRTTAYHGTVRARPPPLTPPRATSHPAQRRGHVATIVSSPACLPHPSGRGGSASSLTSMRSGAPRPSAPSERSASSPYAFSPLAPREAPPLTGRGFDVPSGGTGETKHATGSPGTRTGSSVPRWRDSGCPLLC